MSSLGRERAPITAAAWQAIDEEARDLLKTKLVGRRCVDFEGPMGWEASAVNLGRVDTLGAGPCEGIGARIRRVLPLTELRADFKLSREELEAIDRGAAEPDLAGVERAADAMSLAEDTIIFRGFAAAGITGICEAAAAAGATIALGEGQDALVRGLVEALTRLLDAGIQGPYGLVLGRAEWQSLMLAMDPSGYPVIKRVKQILDHGSPGQVWRTPAIEGGVVLSTRGSDFEMSVGRDLSIGYQDHDAESVGLYLSQSLTFRVHTPEAAVVLSR